MSASDQPIVMTREMAVCLLDWVAEKHHKGVLSAILSARFGTEISCESSALVGEDRFVTISVWNADIVRDVWEFVVSLEQEDGLKWAQSCRVVCSFVAWDNSSS